MTMQKNAVFSFLIAFFLFAVIAILAYTGIFELIESQFYSPTVSQTLIRETTRDAEILGELFTDLQSQFSSSLHHSVVRRSFLPGQSADDIYERSRIFGVLLQSLPGLYSVRFVDLNGIQVHFSTNTADIARSDVHSVVYRNYHEDPASLPFSEVEQTGLVVDDANNRLIFSYPLYDEFDAYRGIALFSVSARVITDALVAAGRLGSGEIMLVKYPAGFIFGLPGISREEILQRISAAWATGYRGIVPFISADVTLALVSVRLDQGYYFGRVINEAILVFPQSIKILVLTAIFLTLFLTIFFIFNFWQVYGRPNPAFLSAEGANALSKQPIQRIIVSLAKILDKMRRKSSGDSGESPFDEIREKDTAMDNEFADLDELDEYAELEELDELEELEELEALDELGELEELEELEAVDIGPSSGEVPIKTGRGLLAAAMLLTEAEKKIITGIPKHSNVKLAFDDDDIPYIVESSGLELVDVDIDETIRYMADEEPFAIEELDAIEVVSPFSSMFTSLNNSDETDDDENNSDEKVILEQDGIHYINNDAVKLNPKTEDEINKDFAKLVESVTANRP